MTSRTQSTKSFRKVKTPMKESSRNTARVLSRTGRTMNTFLKYNEETGISEDLYKCPGSGRMKRSSPQYSIPKAKTRFYLETLQKIAKRNPSP